MSDYKRLTKQAGWHKDIDLKDELGYSYIYQRLAELENKIEQGTLIELPCKVGDTVYAVYDNKVHPVTPWRIWYDGNFFYLNSYKCIYDLLWGSSVFSSRAEAEIEAEKRLLELQGETKL